eukprot:scaffold115657_cov28-Tisochrysis_lutea.AAC.2
MGCDMSASATTPRNRGRSTCAGGGRSVDGVEGMHVGLEAQTKLDVAVAVRTTELGKVGLKRAVGRNVTNLDTPMVHIQIDAVGVDPLEAFSLFADEGRELVAQDARRLGGRKYLRGRAPLAASGGSLVAAPLCHSCARLAPYL